jgi:hypothetical protein
VGSIPMHFRHNLFKLLNILNFKYYPQTFPFQQYIIAFLFHISFIIYYIIAQNLAYALIEGVQPLGCIGLGKPLNPILRHQPEAVGVFLDLMEPEQGHGFAPWVPGPPLN